jgi:telomere length regulation protein
MCAQDLTHLLILTLSLLPFGHAKLVKLAYYSPLLTVMQIFLSHSDPAVRRLGMLVAEVISQMTIPETAAERKEREDRLATRMGKRRKLNAEGKDEKAQEVDELMGGLDIDEEGTPQKSTAKSPTKIKRLEFGPSIWNGIGEGREECRYLRAFVGLQDASATLSSEEDDSLVGWKIGPENAPEVSSNNPATVPAAIRIKQPHDMSEKSKNEDTRRGRRRATPVDSDDESLVGYSSDESASSSRAPSPTPSYLEEIAADPMLNMNTRGKVERPVYIGQLIDLLRAREEPDKLEVGLKWGESLIRRKREFGKELGE